jgi:hypothetical protein
VYHIAVLEIVTVNELRHTIRVAFVRAGFAVRRGINPLRGILHAHGQHAAILLLGMCFVCATYCTLSFSESHAEVVHGGLEGSGWAGGSSFVFSGVFLGRVAVLWEMAGNGDTFDVVYNALRYLNTPRTPLLTLPWQQGVLGRVLSGQRLPRVATLADHPLWSGSAPPKVRGEPSTKATPTSTSETCPTRTGLPPSEPSGGGRQDRRNQEVGRHLSCREGLLADHPAGQRGPRAGADAR